MLLISDYDNTYELHYENLDLLKIFKQNHEAVRNFMKSNNKFVIASGRHFNAMKKTIDEKNLMFDYLITNNGAELYDKNYKLLYSLPIEKRDILKMKQIENKIQVFYRHPYKNGDITSINIYTNDMKEYTEIRKDLEKELSQYLIEFKYPKIKIINEKCNKVNCVRIIEQIENVNHNDIYVIGDEINDIKMIKDYEGFSLNTANPEVKKISKKNYDSLSELIGDIMKCNIIK